MPKPAEIVNKPLPTPVEIPEIETVKKAVKPLSFGKSTSKYSVKSTLEQKTEVAEDELVAKAVQNLPTTHFTETDMQSFWAKFLEETRQKDAILYNAISGFTLKKLEEDTIEINYPSLTAKAEFDKISGSFLKDFQYAMHHYHLKVEYKSAAGKMKKQARTKKVIFEEYCEINPLLRELDDLFKFDLS